MIILKTILRICREDLIISDSDFNNFVGVDLDQWIKCEITDENIDLATIKNICLLCRIDASQVFQIEVFVRQELSNTNIIHLDRASRGDDLTSHDLSRIYWTCKKHLKRYEERNNQKNINPAQPIPQMNKKNVQTSDETCNSFTHPKHETGSDFYDMPIFEPCSGLDDSCTPTLRSCIRYAYADDDLELLDIPAFLRRIRD